MFKDNIKLKLIKKIRKMLTCARLDLETLGALQVKPKQILGVGQRAGRGGWVGRSGGPLLRSP